MNEKNLKLRELVLALCDEHKDVLLFHGWHHVQFVTSKATQFARSLGADEELVEASALVHDLNYIIEVNSEPEKGAELRASVLAEANFDATSIERIEFIVHEAHTANRGTEISPEAMALSDGDALFKSLPITPILFASKYLSQNKVDIEKLAHKVVSEQKPLLEQDIYFYSDQAKTYLCWAKVNLELWANVEEALKDDDVSKLIETAYHNDIL